MPKNPDPTIVKSVKIPLSQVREIEDLASKTGMKRHQIMRQAITEFLVNSCQERKLSDVKKSS
jgi:predicted transcriptional regulator